MERVMLVHELKERVARSAYVVDCGAVADALLARQARCSNPLSVTSPWDDLSEMPAGPRITRPTGSSGRSAGPDAKSS
jgi:hypothetical protein